MNSRRKLRALAAAGVLTVALALPIGATAATESSGTDRGANLEAPAQNSPARARDRSGRRQGRWHDWLWRR